jgi:ATP-dependent protease ClpP protease subunit
LTICHAIGSTAATTVADVTMAMSAATYIALSCDCVITHYETEFMCHDRMSGTYGHGRENRKLTIHTDKYFEHLSKKIYKGFLTDKEIAKITTSAI